MKFEVIECEQRSDAWIKARLGRLTGSKAAAMMSKVKSGEAAGRRNLRVSLALERVTGKPQQQEFTTADLDHGIEYEPVALGAYESRTGYIVDRTGFLSCGPILAGCSLDGHVNDFDGITEVKCPNRATHLDYLRTKNIPHPYSVQCVHNLWISGAKWCDFVSYSPYFPERLQYVCVRMERDEGAIKIYEAEAMRFLAEVNLEVKSIMEMAAA